MCRIGNVGPIKFVQMMILCWIMLTLTYLTSRSNLLPNAFKWVSFFFNFYFLNTVEAKVIILT